MKSNISASLTLFLRNLFHFNPKIISLQSDVDAKEAKSKQNARESSSYKSVNLIFLFIFVQRLQTCISTHHMASSSTWRGFVEAQRSVWHLIHDFIYPP